MLSGWRICQSQDSTPKADGEQRFGAEADESEHADDHKQFSTRIVQCGGDQDYGREERKAWRSYRRDRQGDTGAGLDTLLKKTQTPFGETLFQAFFTAFSSDPIRGEAAEHRSQGCHGGVIWPQIMVPRGENHDQNVEGKRQEKKRRIDDSQKENANTA